MNQSRATVVKVGGDVAASRPSLDAMWTQLARLAISKPVIVVHGGGVRATEVARRMGHEPQIIHGRRVTSDTDLEIVQWTLRGEMSLRLVSGAARAGLRAVGISGADARTVRVTRRPPWSIDGRDVDFGWVGDVCGIDTTLIDTLLSADMIPVVAPIGIDDAGLIYNVNADTVAAEIAIAVKANEFLLVTGSGGVRSPGAGDTDILKVCNQNSYDDGISTGWISNGMRVKLHVALDALERGVGSAHIVGPHDVIDRRSSTEVVL